MRTLTFLLLLMLATPFFPARANAESNSSAVEQEPAPAAATTSSAAQSEGPIQDNSFLVEEAYNQEDGVIQHISFVQFLNSHDVVYTQTDEWPLRSLKHQLSVTASVNKSGNYRVRTGLGRYRSQLPLSACRQRRARLAISPVFPCCCHWQQRRGTGLWRLGLADQPSYQPRLNRHIVTHWNAGVTWIPSAQDAQHNHATVVNPNLAQSTVWLVKPRFNALCEVVWTNNASVVASGQTARQQALFVSPGVRWAYNFKSGLQIVPGVAVPMGLMGASCQRGAIFYLSSEHPFALAHSR